MHRGSRTASPGVGVQIPAQRDVRALDAEVPAEARHTIPECIYDVALAAARVRASDPQLAARAEGIVEWARGDRGDAAPAFDSSNNALGPAPSHGHRIWNLCTTAWEESREIESRGGILCRDVEPRADPHSVHVLESWLAATDATGTEGPRLRGPINQTLDARPRRAQIWEDRKDAVKLIEAVDGQYAMRSAAQGHPDPHVPEAALIGPPRRPGRVGRAVAAARQHVGARGSVVPMAVAVSQRGGAVVPLARAPVHSIGPGLMACYDRMRALAYRYRLGLEDVLGRRRGERGGRPLAAEGVWRQLHRVRRAREVGEKKRRLTEDAEEMERLARRANSRKAKFKVQKDWIKCRTRGLPLGRDGQLARVHANVCNARKDDALREVGRAAAARWRRAARVKASEARRAAWNPARELRVPGRELPENAVINVRPDDIREARSDLARAENYARYGWDSPITMRILDAYASMKEVEHNASVVAGLMRALNIPVPEPHDCYACEPGTMGPCRNNTTLKCGPKTWKNGMCRQPMVPCNHYGAAARDPRLEEFNPLTGEHPGNIRDMLRAVAPRFVRREDMPRTPRARVSRRRSATGRPRLSRRTRQRPGSAAPVMGRGLARDASARARARLARVPVSRARSLQPRRSARSRTTRKARPASAAAAAAVPAPAPRPSMRRAPAAPRSARVRLSRRKVPEPRRGSA